MTVALRLACPACGRTEWRAGLTAGAHTLVRCRCGLGALEDQAAAAASNEELYGGEEYNAWYRGMKDVLVARYRRDCAEIERLVPSKGAMLDVGCSYGWFLEVARERGWHTTGIEVTDATARPAREAGLDVRTGTLAEAAFDDATFSVVGLWDVLEHVPAVDEFLGECRRVLAPGGLLALQSPNIASVMARSSGAEWPWLLLPQHVWHFTPRSIRATLEHRGFAVERAYTWEPLEALVQSFGPYRRHPRVASSRIARRAGDRLLGAASALWSRAGYGGLLRVYARRLP